MVKTSSQFIRGGGKILGVEAYANWKTIFLIQCAQI